MIPALALSLLCASASAEPSLSVQARAVSRGEVALVIVEGADRRRPPEASFRGRALDFFPAASTGTWLAFLPLDLDAPVGESVLAATLRDAKGRPVRKTETLTVGAGAFPVEELKVEQKYVTPAKSDDERIESESAQLKQIWRRVEPKRLFEGRFDAPIPGAATARFGERRVFNGQPRAPHSGMDLKAKAGTPVRAPAAGVVVLAGPLYFSGNTIIVDHGLGVKTLYAHLSRMSVKTGDAVKKGQLLGKVGATGRVTGPHLHWGLKVGEARVDPYSLTALDLDAYLRPRAADPLAKSPACERTDLPPAPRWGKASRSLRLRARPLKAEYAPGEPVGLLVEIQNLGRRSVFLDFVRDSDARATTLGVGAPPTPFSALASSATARLATEQVKIPPKKVLCFEQDRGADGPLLARETTAYALTYGTDFLYSTSTARAGVWRGRLTARPVPVVVSTRSFSAP
ncbi:MAG: M23 family metallopeptidase [Elusimicrobia bacterium]|nr:M23 family metallopeptidase [Elusimicrobiota bacterium]